MRAHLAALGLAIALFLAGMIAGHDAGVADGEAKVRQYQQADQLTPAGFYTTVEGDTIIVHCPAEDSCSSHQDGRKIIVTPRHP